MFTLVDHNLELLLSYFVHEILGEQFYTGPKMSIILSTSHQKQINKDVLGKTGQI